MTCNQWAAEVSILRIEATNLAECSKSDSFAPRYCLAERFEFPADLPALYRQQEISARVLDALREIGKEAVPFLVDCSEYPCIVFIRQARGHEVGRVVEARALEVYRRLGAYGGARAHDEKHFLNYYYISFFDCERGARYRDQLDRVELRVKEFEKSLVGELALGDPVPPPRRVSDEEAQEMARMMELMRKSPRTPEDNQEIRRLSERMRERDRAEDEAASSQ